MADTLGTVSMAGMVAMVVDTVWPHAGWRDQGPRLPVVPGLMPTLPDIQRDVYSLPLADSLVIFDSW